MMVFGADYYSGTRLLSRYYEDFPGRDVERYGQSWIELWNQKMCDRANSDGSYLVVLNLDGHKHLLIPPELLGQLFFIAPCAATIL